MISSPPFPVDLAWLDSGEVLVLPAVWPVRLDAEQRRRFAERLLAGPPDRSDTP
ncbi:hypothetical protein AB0J63_26650 [Streptosporangium canum]|uniref:hypothetical protein n=1 Tax=Streptosporangium canum TaxID=324952 RepID=UPI00342DF832